MKDIEILDIQPGPIVLFGSGETTPSGRKIFEELFKRLPHRPSIALLETPAGFELNSDLVIKRISNFLQHSFQNYLPETVSIPARKRGTVHSPDNPKVVSPILSADMIFMGPGSPTYAVRQLAGSLAWDYIVARNLSGAALALASSAVIAISAFSLPVYEIFKVGDELHWKDGLDFFSLFNQRVVFIPHWNNNDGGSDLDTSRCFIGKPRFARLLEMLPLDTTIIGIDEKTALLMDLNNTCGCVIGRGGVTVISKKGLINAGESDLSDQDLNLVIKKRDLRISVVKNGQKLPLAEILPFKRLARLEEIPRPVRELFRHEQMSMNNGQNRLTSSSPFSINDLPEEVAKLLAAREMARKKKDWASADKIRATIRSFGWLVNDTPDGPELIRE